MTIRINEKAQGGIYFPEVKVIFRSENLWRNGWQEAVKKTIEWLEEWLVYSKIIVSRCDLTADFNVPIPILDLSQFVTRAVNKRIYQKGNFNVSQFSQGKKLSGYVIGSKELQCRIYDKLLELAKNTKSWFMPIWEANGWEKEDPSTRVEFQCRRKYLKSMQTDSVQDLILQIADLWRNLVFEWLTIHEIGTDSHRNRWKLTEFWLLVQSALGNFGVVTGVSRLKQQRPRYQKISRQVRGHLVSLHALVMCSMNNASYKFVQKQIANLIKHYMYGTDFQDDVLRRKAKYSGMDN
jgi:hypothetical protein